MFGWGGRRPQHPSREDQVKALKAHPRLSLAPVTNLPDAWDQGLQLLAQAIVLRVRISLPPGFPEQPPVVEVTDRTTVHPWLEPATQRVRVGGPNGAPAWSANDNLGNWFDAIIKQFMECPPRWYPPASTPQQQAQQQQQQQQAAAAAAASPGGRAPLAGPAVASGRPPLPSQQPTPAAQPARPRVEAPAMPASWAWVYSLPLAQLQELLESADARDQLLRERIPELREFSALATASVANTLEAAQEVAGLQERVAAAQARVGAAEGRAAASVAAANAALRQVRDVSERYTPAALARELEAAADDHDRTSEALAASFVSEESFERFGGGGGGGSGSAGGFGSAPSVGSAGNPGQVAGGSERDGASVTTGSGTAGPVREFREDYLALRRQYHLARIRAAILRSQGLVG